MPSANKNGIVASGRELDALLAFMGDSEEQAILFFKTSPTHVRAGATSKRSAVHVKGKASGAESGEWPVAREFVELCLAACVDGSPNVPAHVCRFVVERDAIRFADIIDKVSGRALYTLTNKSELEPNRQLSFAQVSDQIQANDGPGSWFAFNPQRDFAPLRKISAACEKCPVTCRPAKDEVGSVVYEAKGEGGEWSAIIMPVPVVGPGLAARDPAPDDEPDSDDGSDDDDPPDSGAAPAEDPQNPPPLKLAPTPRPARGPRPVLGSEKAKKKRPRKKK